MALYDTSRLYITKDAYHLVPESGGPLSSGQQGNTQPSTLVINRLNNEISTSASLSPPVSYDSAILVYGLFGIVSLYDSDYLIFITARKRVARLFDTDIYLARDFKVFAVDPSLSRAAVTKSTGLQHPNETVLLGLVKGHLFSGPFYYTYGAYDITTRLQAQDMSDSRPLYERADDRFFWNKHLQKRLIELAGQSNGGNVSPFILPVMFGFCTIKAATINARDFMFGVVSRRSRHRAGTRYFSRGIDEHGHVSNFNETEQILVLDRTKEAASAIRGEIRASYVQIRGSVPIYWAEVNNLRYKPDLVIMDLAKTTDSLRRHFDSILPLYGDLLLVNLVNQKGYEKPVKEALEKAITALGDPQVRYTYFDFHHECKGPRFDRVSLLLDRLSDDLQQQGYFFHDLPSSPTRPQMVQKSIIRSNCMDSLDRTNVVQSTFAKDALTHQLQQAGVLKSSEGLDSHRDFVYLYRNVWADNADVISKAYSGTGALKTDYTRTGKRTNEGLLQDGINSLMRYVKNNFLDGPRQDAYDLVTGTWVPRKGDRRPFVDHRPLLTRMVPYAIFLSLATILLILWAPRFATVIIPSRAAVLLISFAVLGTSTFYMTAHGVDYVAWPRLRPLTESINYTGDGYTSGRHGRGFASDNARHLSSKRLDVSTGDKVEKDTEPGTGKKRLD